MKKIIPLILASIFIFTSISFGASNMQNKLNDIKSQSSGISKEIKAKQGEVANISKNIADIESQITQSENNIINMEAQIVVLTENIKIAENDINKYEEKIIVNKELLGERINVMYKKGDVAYIEILVTSHSFNELLANFNVIKKIVDYDRQLLTELKDIKDTIATRKKEMEQSKIEIEKIKKEVEIEKAKLEANEEAQRKAKDLISGDLEKLKIQEDQLLKQAKDLEKQIKELTVNSTMGATYSGGSMGWPLAITGTITSPFGYRKHPIYGSSSMHTGLDIAAPKGTGVLAVADGVVISAGYAGSYGNMIMVDHGGGIVTLYAHNSAIVASKGQKVSRGSVIAKVGTTGASTGNHLHFEVRVNGKYMDPRKYI